MDPPRCNSPRKPPLGPYSTSPNLNVRQDSSKFKKSPRQSPSPRSRVKGVKVKSLKEIIERLDGLSPPPPSSAGASSAKSLEKKNNAENDDVVIVEGIETVERAGSVPRILTSGPDSVPSIHSDTSLSFFNDLTPLLDIDSPKSNIKAGLNWLPKVPSSGADSLSSLYDLSSFGQSNNVATPYSNLIPRIPPNVLSPLHDPSSLTCHDLCRKRNYMAADFMPRSSSNPQMPRQAFSQQFDPTSLSFYRDPSSLSFQDLSLNTNCIEDSFMPGSSSNLQMPQSSFLQQFDPSLSFDSRPGLSGNWNNMVGCLRYSSEQSTSGNEFS